jgi:hypothetical protein
MRLRRAHVALAVAFVVLMGTALPADAAEFRAFAELTGPNEVPGPGDPDGRGVGIVDIHSKGRVCVNLAYDEIKRPFGFHIHRGTATEAGPVVVEFSHLLPSGDGCVEADPALLEEIRANPSGFYLNVHNEAFPGGAIRGQLRRARN